MRQTIFCFLLLTGLPGWLFAVVEKAPGTLAAAPGSAQFQKFSTPDGLPIAGVSSLFQDSKGFLWVGSYTGLFRFDGYQFVRYEADAQNDRSISALNITTVYETRSGRMWVGTSNGLNLYDRNEDSFKSYKFTSNNPHSISDSYVKSIFEDSDGVLWVGSNSGGLSRFDDASGGFSNYRYRNDGDNPVNAIVEDKHGYLWIGTGDGLKKFNRENGSFENFRTDFSHATGSGNNSIVSMTIDRFGIIWLGTLNGLNSFDPETERFRRYINDESNPGSLNDNLVRSVHETKTGALWIGTASGLNLYSRSTDSFTLYKHDPANPGSVSEGQILAILEGNDEQLWIGSTGGLNKLNQKMNRFFRFRHRVNDPNTISNDEILSIYEDKKGKVWIGTRINGQQGQLNRYDPQTNRFEIIKDFNTEVVYTIFGDREGKIWFGTLSGLIYMDPDTGQISRFSSPPEQGIRDGNASVASVLPICETLDGKLLLGTIGYGMATFDRSTKQFAPFPHDPETPESLDKNRVYAIVQDRLKDIWIGTGGGLSKLGAESHSFKRYRFDPRDPKSISADDIGTIYEDRNGTIWIGTSSGGLNRFDRETETFSRFTQADGLPSNDVFGIMEDEQGNLWLSTDRGLSRFNIATGIVRNFNVNDGVPNNPFDNKTAFKNARGEMYFGGQDGFVKFDPKDFSDSASTPPVYVTDIRLLEKRISARQNIAELKDLNLSWKDYVVSFDLAALDLIDPGKLQYRWKLDGFDPDWINGGPRRTATYSNLPGGDYVLKAMATNSEGTWGKEFSILKVHVEPPFYRTYWFIVICVTAAALFVWIAYRYRIRQLQAISTAQTRFTQQLIANQEDERKRLASELHDGLGQSLVIIKNRAMLGLSKSEDSSRVAKELGSISESASQALDEVREITNNLRPQLLDRLGLTKALLSMCKKISGVVEIDCHFDAIDNIFNEDQEINMYRIVQESLNNVIKHSNASNASVKITRGEGDIYITVADNGSGFDPAIVDSQPIGLGLVGLRERTHLLDGEFAIESGIGEGTEIKVRIPVGKRAK